MYIKIRVGVMDANGKGPFSLKWFNFNHSMDK